jgi:hypothetical protein
MFAPTDWSTTCDRHFGLLAGVIAFAGVGFAISDSYDTFWDRFRGFLGFVGFFLLFCLVIYLLPPLEEECRGVYAC